MNKKFDEAFKQLNIEQRQAVEAIEGPVFVIAGPGTGKTQLLAMRAAQILRVDTTMSPSNILCLTFTDNAADNMRARLIKYIGQDAYQVGIHTFNSFGSYVMNAYPENFYEWREMQTADELSTHRILEGILTELPGNHILAASGSDGSFYSLRQLKSFIRDAKSNNLTPTDIQSILAANQSTYTELLPLIQQYWPERINKQSLSEINALIKIFSSIKLPNNPVDAIQPIKQMLVKSLLAASAQSSELEVRLQTKPFTVWKDRWLAKDGEKQWIFNGQKHHDKLVAATEVYERYQTALLTRGLTDFSDQIMWVLRTLQEQSELRYNLQERFQYVMIDEFQDTNRAQLLMAHYITDAPVHEGRPNIMVVGDDDQAIFRFQGADIGNVGLFEASYKKPQQIRLTTNYRSTQKILDSSRLISSQIELSLQAQRSIVKDLKSTVSAKGSGVALNEFDHEAQHYAWIADHINQLIKQGVSAGEIAVLARVRSQLDDLMPYLSRFDIPIDYERRENVLEQPHVMTLFGLARLVLLIGEQQLDEVNTLLPKILSEPMWAIPPLDLWKVSQKTYQHNLHWLDVIFEQENTKLREVVDFLVGLGNLSITLPAEQILDQLVGTGPAGADSDEDEAELISKQSSGVFTSPFKNYYFGAELKDGKPTHYLSLLSQLSTLRRHLRNYQVSQNKTLKIRDLIDFVDSYQRTDTLRMLDTGPHREQEAAVKLMTIHKAKGLEFDTVFVIALQNNAWSKQGRSGRFSYPQNLKIIEPSASLPDDGLRLLFVAMTRAKSSLLLNYFLRSDDDKPQQLYAPLLALDVPVTNPKVDNSTAALVEQYEQRWLARHGSLSKTDMRACLQENLDRYQLSATHLNNFLDVSAGGPLYFLTQNLLHFPASKSPYSIYGSLIHTALRQAHEQTISKQKLNIELVIRYFKSEIKRQALTETDKQLFSQKGEEILRVFLLKEAANFIPTQRIEFDFKDQGVAVGQARLRGLIDRMDFDSKSKLITVSDYKTGRAVTKWQLAPSTEEYERIKLYRYRNQLLFYKLLVDGSSEWGRKGWRAASGLLRFVEPISSGKIITLDLIYTAEEIKRFTKLVEAVWQRIQKLDFADTSGYPPTLEGIKLFEDDLMSKS